MSVYPPPTESLPIFNPVNFDEKNSDAKSNTFSSFRLTSGAVSSYKLQCQDSAGDGAWVPSLTSNIIEVSPSFSNGGLKFNSIYAAVQQAIALGASASIPYEIKVYPGTYNESNVITVSPGINILGDISRHLTQVNYTGPLTSGAFFTLQGDSQLKYLNIVGSNNVDYCIEITGTFNDCVLEQLQCFGANIACYHESSNSFGNVFHIGCQAQNTSTPGFQTPLGWLIDGNVTSFVQLSACVDLTFSQTMHGFRLNSSSASINLSLSESLFCNRGIWITDAATVDLGASYLQNCTTGLYVEPTSTCTINTSGLVFSGNIADINLNNGSSTFNITGSIVSPNKYTPSTNSLAQYVSNDTDSRYSFEQGQPTFINETYNGLFLSQATLKAFKYNGSAYTDVSAAIKQSGATTTTLFDSLTTSIFYLGNTSGMFPALLANIQTAGVMGTNGTNYVYEYWSGAAWTSFNVMGLNEVYPYASYANQPLQNTGMMSIRFDQVFSSATTSNWATVAVNGVTAYWIRIRILTSITSSPIITWIKEFGNTLRIRQSGTIAYFGRSMLKNIAFYDIQLMQGNATNQTLWANASPVIDRILTNNSFSNAGTATSGLSFLINPLIDTSSGFYLILSWLTDGILTSTISLTVSWCVTSDGDVISLSSGAAPTNSTAQSTTFTLTPTINTTSRQVTSTLALPIPSIALRNSSGTVNKVLWITLLRNASANTDRWILSQLSLLSYSAVNTL